MPQQPPHHSNSYVCEDEAQLLHGDGEIPLYEGMERNSSPQISTEDAFFNLL